MSSSEELPNAMVQTEDKAEVAADWASAQTGLRDQEQEKAHSTKRAMVMQLEGATMPRRGPLCNSDLVHPLPGPGCGENLIGPEPRILVEARLDTSLKRGESLECSSLRLCH